eukprot:3389804-Prymnesium_polylepis.1
MVRPKRSSWSSFASASEESSHAHRRRRMEPSSRRSRSGASILASASSSTCVECSSEKVSPRTTLTASAVSPET